jgi:hypothetical protein
MKYRSLSVASWTALVLAGVFLFTVCSSGGAKLADKKYPEGFSLKHPKDWQARVEDKAYILVSSPETAEELAFLFVYPFFLKTTAPAGAWFEQSLPKLSKFFAKASIEKRQQLAGNVSQIVSQTNQEISIIINDACWTRQGVMDNISRRFSNYILGVTDVADPETGQTWKVEAGHNYYWAKPYGNVVVGTETFTRPDIDFTPLRELK